ncbi:MAG TPA: YXWGXW repeat-containing protein [Acetobacteraceae bacterium]|nr:YXWGXW repeat-containing protein [Acetobacteraceae bacterium]
MRLTVAFMMLGVAAPLLGGCVVATTPPPYPPVPTPLAETVPLPPVSETALVWQPGHWDWTGTAYVWAPGRYVPRGNHGRLWQNGYWQFVNGGYAWVPGHWIMTAGATVIP